MEKKYTIVSGTVETYPQIKVNNENRFEDINDMDYILDQWAGYMQRGIGLHIHRPVYTGEVCGLNRLDFEREPDVWEMEDVKY